MIKADITYQAFTQEDLENGDTDNHGYLEQDLEFESRKEALQYFEETYGYYEPNCSDESQANSYYTVDDDVYSVGRQLLKDII